MCEDGGELISFTTWAWMWRGIRIVDAFIMVALCQAKDKMFSVLPMCTSCETRKCKVGGEEKGCFSNFFHDNVLLKLA